MIRVVSIVEGDGEVQALPVLLRRLSGWLTPEAITTVEPPIRVHRDKFIRRVDEFTESSCSRQKNARKAAGS
jgi:hypothetical protein